MEMSDVKLTIAIPYGKPNRNGTIFSEDAVMKAVSTLHKNLPIKLDNGGFSKVVGNTTGDCHLVRWDSEKHTCYVTVDGKLYGCGIEGVVNEYEGNEVKDFDIRALSLTFDKD